MEISIFLGKVLGLYLIAVSGLYVFRQKYINEVINDYKHSISLKLTNGILALIIGLLIIVSHNIWVWDWRFIITAIGYISTVKGIFILYFPEKIDRAGETIAKGNTMKIIGVITLACGLILLYKGFFLNP